MIKVKAGGSMKIGVLRFECTGNLPREIAQRQPWNVEARFQFYNDNVYLDFEFNSFLTSKIRYIVNQNTIERPESELWRIDAFKLILIEKYRFLAIGRLHHISVDNIRYTWDFAGEFKGKLPLRMDIPFVTAGRIKP